MIILLDNGSKRPEATLNLRRLAAALSCRLARPVAPVSLLHSSKIPAEQLQGRPASTLEPFLRQQAAEGLREAIAVPLFFGPSRALSEMVPEVAQRVSAQSGPLQVHVADELCPLPGGEPRLVDILEDHVRPLIGSDRARGRRVILVDHGSPIPEVTAVRRWLAAQLAQRFAGDAVAVAEAVMERRSGSEYDFNGQLLADVLNGCGEEDPNAHVVLAMQFISPGRHAGAGGDIAQIAEAATARHPDMQITISRLMGEHPQFEEILAARALAALERHRPSEL
jgi:sirohydrochlorin ferrochelatase